ncbi:hypothetical protein [Devosia sp.]|uniref:hypothetical protein n=1 Tax=Devosia sp. TaxID=1871048 RepID=UPI002FC7C2C8
MTAAAALALSILLAGLAVLQAGLAAGAPLGHFAWGGQYRTLPTGLRIGSLVAIVIYAVIAAIALQKAGLVAWLPGGDWIGIAAWVAVAYLATGIPLNAISHSRPERLTMTPIVALLFVLTLVVALGL